MNIPVIYSKNSDMHNPKSEISEGKLLPYSEKAERANIILKELKKRGYKNLIETSEFGLEFVEKVHSKNYTTFLKRLSNKARKRTIFPSYHILDTYTPVQKWTFKAAKKSADVVLTGAKMIAKGERVVYSLCRPPGHHAEANKMGGYCYFNNTAIAAEYLSGFGKVAIFDIDFHHGNGTQNIFYSRKDVLFVSIHADPSSKYPYLTGFKDEIGTENGKGFNKNYPLRLGTGEIAYLKTFKIALREIKKFRPKYLVISVGLDTYINDPLGGFKLKIPFYKKLGKEISSLKIPTLIVQEGGYNIGDLGKLTVSFLDGF